MFPLSICCLLLCAAFVKPALTHHSSARFKADYLEACQRFSEHYIYFERKLPMSRRAFLADRQRHADTIPWDQAHFIREIRSLCATFPDGHVSWALPSELCPRSNWFSLGFVATVTQDQRVMVARTLPGFALPFQAGDEILRYQGQPTLKAVDQLGALAPRSTPAATREGAARRLGCEADNMPLRDSLQAVAIETQDQAGIRTTATLNWKPVDTSIRQGQQPTLLLTRFGLPSMEDLPADAMLAPARSAAFVGKS